MKFCYISKREKESESFGGSNSCYIRRARFFFQNYFLFLLDRNIYSLCPRELHIPHVVQVSMQLERSKDFGEWRRPRERREGIERGPRGSEKWKENVGRIRVERWSGMNCFRADGVL